MEDNQSCFGIAVDFGEHLVRLILTQKEDSLQDPIFARGS
jgi:hypothetical protein